MDNSLNKMNKIVSRAEFIAKDEFQCQAQTFFRAKMTSPPREKFIAKDETLCQGKNLLQTLKFRSKGGEYSA